MHGNSTLTFESHRPRLFGLCYRMLGVRADAEDAVQETFARWLERDHHAVEHPEAWLVTMATRICIDRLRRLSVQRKVHQGPWLPEPLPTAEDPDQAIDRHERLSLAFLYLLERLAPEERAVLLLCEVFDLAVAQVASIIGKSDVACRQMLHRARDRVQDGRRHQPVADEQVRDLFERFGRAAVAQDDAALLALLLPDAVWLAGGGERGAARRPIVGADRIQRLVRGLMRKHGTWLGARLVRANGEWALLSQRAGRPLTLLCADVVDGRFARLLHVADPKKLEGFAVTLG